jgi:hypothetical protein
MKSAPLAKLLEVGDLTQGSEGEGSLWLCTKQVQGGGLLCVWLWRPRLPLLFGSAVPRVLVSLGEWSHSFPSAQEVAKEPGSSGSYL